MNTCQSYEEKFSEYLENDISRTDKINMERHLKTCPLCAQKNKNIKMLRLVISKMPRVKVSSDFDSLLRARIRLEARHKRLKSEYFLFSPKTRFALYGTSFAVFALFFMLIFSTINTRNTSYPQAAVNETWKGGRGFVKQSSSGPLQTSAIKVYSQPPYRTLSRRQENISTIADTSTLILTDSRSNQLQGRIYRTKSY